MQKKICKEKVKQEYRKPKLRTIELTAEEVLAPGCKIGGENSFGTGPPPCTTGFCATILGS